MTIHITEIDVPRGEAFAGGNWKLSHLKDVTVLFGKNGSGKSQLLRALRDARSDGTHYVAPERAGDIEFNAGLMQQQFEANTRREASKRNLAPDYRQQVLARIQTYLAVRGSDRSGKPLAGNPAEIEEFLGRLNPDFGIKITGGVTPYEVYRIGTSETVRSVEKLSSGEAQLLTVGIDILTMAAIWELQGKEPRVLFIDEPDAHIHPDLQARFARFLIEVCDRYGLQAFVGTHSTTLLSALGQFGGNRAGVIYLDPNAAELRPKEFTQSLREMATFLGGNLLMGPLFGAPILLVEGDDDYQIWSQVPRHHLVNLAVLPANGDEMPKYQKALEQIFTSLLPVSASPIGYALRDGDVSVPSPGSTSQKYVKFIRLNCREAENLYLTDEVIEALGTTWAEGQLKIASAAGEYGAKEPLLKAAPTWDRRSADFKVVINQVSAILDPKNVSWTKRVGTAIGRERPRGQLADFLGADLLTALWPGSSS